MRKDDTAKIPFYKSIFGKIIMAVSFSFLVVIVLSFIWLYAGVKDSLRKRTDEEMLSSYKLLEQNLATFGNEIEQVTLRILNQSVMTNLVKTDKSEIENIEKRIEFFNMTDTILAEYKFVDSIVFYNADDLTLFADGRWNVISENSEERGRFYRERLEKRSEMPQNAIWYGGYNSLDFVKIDKENQKPVNYISVCRTIFRGRQQGWLVINVDLNYFVNYYNTLSEDGSWSEETYMLDQYCGAS